MSAISEFSCLLESAEKTQEFAGKLARLCKTGDCLLLYGEVGMGKTTFARGFIRSIVPICEEITSPTFTLVQSYPMPGGYEVWHCDLYRLKHENELLELGLEDAFGRAIMLVEWPEIAIRNMPEDALRITLSAAGQGRKITLNGETAAWAGRFKVLEEILI